LDLFDILFSRNIGIVVQKERKQQVMDSVYVYSIAFFCKPVACTIFRYNMPEMIV